MPAAGTRTAVGIHVLPYRERTCRPPEVSAHPVATLGRMREFELLEHVLATGVTGFPQVIIGPGDDMAMVEVGGARLLAAVDQVVAGRHVRLESTPIELVGRKAVTRSLSDIAAMAARPIATLATAALPPDFGQDHATALFDAMRKTAELFKCPLIGGDIAFHERPGQPLVCSVAVLAEPTAAGPVVRSGAKVGDTVYVTGALGGSVDAAGGGRHLTFEPRIAEAIQLAELLSGRLHALIDLSDGLGRDASHIAAESGVRIEIDAASVPCQPDCDWKRAMSDGEDYELCFAAEGAVPDHLGELPVTAVGRVVSGAEDHRPHVLVYHDGQSIPGDELGWQHAS